ncbi:RmlD-like substrate binding domain-containing protein [Tricharina praecox]|uniref:RmlD-like substrate binding domain-containing protein n=1 Tax=Tricharina praecox TaxID=43433 RepID=UPI00221ED71F|nr:RmlD-like substrate binding domain-containing protein [Tricharina praecox]KAI5854323.1 RmlD-like substrate binding domain-containing protein [Tricharina praecox]
MSEQQQEQKTVVITGATGQLGRQCVKAFENAEWKVIGTGFSRASGSIQKLDLTDSTAVSALLSSTRPSVVVHTAAERSPDRCATDQAGTTALNVDSTSLLARLCADMGSTLIYISTDYVFPGTPGEAPYSAGSPTAPPNFYGATKLAGEGAVLDEPGGVVFRVPVLYGEVEVNGESAVNTLLDVVWNAGGKAKVDMDHWSVRYPTNTADVARVLVDVAERYARGMESKEEMEQDLPRVLQFSSEERMTKYEICQTMADVAGLPLEHVVPNAENDLNAAVQRPYDCHLSTQELKDLGIDVRTVKFRDWW